MRKSSRGGGWAIFAKRVQQQAMQPFLGWVLELDACFAEEGFGPCAWYALNAVAPVNYALQRCAPLRERLNREQPAFARSLGATVGSSRRIVPRGVSERLFGSIFGALCFARAVGGARHVLVDRGRRDGEEVPGAWG